MCWTWQRTHQSWVGHPCQNLLHLSAPQPVTRRYSGNSDRLPLTIQWYYHIDIVRLSHWYSDTITFIQWYYHIDSLSQVELYLFFREIVNWLKKWPIHGDYFPDFHCCDLPTVIPVNHLKNYLIFSWDQLYDIKSNRGGCCCCWWWWRCQKKTLQFSAINIDFWA